MNVANIISPAFDNVFWDAIEHNHTFYWLKGGRGSCKSSFVSILLSLLILQNSNCHAVILRKVGSTIKGSVFSQIQWALSQLGIADRFIYRKSPFEITYKPTGQKIFFFGVDDPMKIKSLKPPFGYIGIVWFEELDQFSGMEEIRSLNQSLLRGGAKFWEFCSYNPPKSRDNWVNSELLFEDTDRMVHHSNYLTVPREWLGDEFFYEAEKLKAKNEVLYNHEYLGEVTGTGGAVFENVEEGNFSDEDIKAFDRLYFGIDFGFAVDPLAFVCMHYDSKRETLFIYDEIYRQKLSNTLAIREIKELTNGKVIFADSAEPRTISEFRQGGLDIYGAKKGADSIEHGIKWLQERTKIIIDKKRCPNAYREFVNYEYEKNKDGQFISAYPDRNNHSIDAVRYGLYRVMQNDGITPKRVNY